MIRGSLTVVAIIGACIAASAQDQSVLYLFAMDAKGTPILSLKESDITVKEDRGPSTIVSVSRFGWPLKVTVLVENSPRTSDALVHYRSGLKKFFAGLPGNVLVSLISTAPNPRWMVRDSKDPVQIEKAVNLITPDDGLARFSDSLIEYADRLDNEFRNVSAERLPPYLPVLVSITNTHQDGSLVSRDSNRKMILSLRKHHVWTNMVMISPNRGPNEPAGLPTVDYDEGQNAEIAKIVQESTNGRYIPITGSGTSALNTSILPDLARAISARYIRQMTQHRIILERPQGSTGPMKDFRLALLNHPGAKIIVSTDGNLP